MKIDSTYTLKSEPTSAGYHYISVDAYSEVRPFSHHIYAVKYYGESIKSNYSADKMIKYPGNTVQKLTFGESINLSNSSSLEISESFPWSGRSRTEISSSGSLEMKQFLTSYSNNTNLADNMFNHSYGVSYEIDGRTVLNIFQQVGWSSYNRKAAESYNHTNSAIVW